MNLEPHKDHTVIIDNQHWVDVIYLSTFKDQINNLKELLQNKNSNSLASQLNASSHISLDMECCDDTLKILDFYTPIQMVFLRRM